MSSYAPKDSPVFTNTISMGRKTDYGTGDNSVAIGDDVIAAGRCSCAVGHSSYATGMYAFSEGGSNTASGVASHTEGMYAQATGDFAHAEGHMNAASNFASHASGHMCKAMTNGGTNSNTVGDAFVIGNGVSSTRANCFRVTYAGAVYGKSAFNSSGADYAEYFEWMDSNPDNQDRVGYFVTLEGKNIKIAQPNDYILGIVSGQPCIIGNADEDWLGRWQRDEFGRFVIEYLEQTEEKDEYGFNIEKAVDYETPSWRHKPNPEYDNTQEYIERKDRPEWDVVGMLGVLSVRDDGTCAVDGYCKVADGGIATNANEYIVGKTYRVIERVSANVVKIVFK